MSHIQGNRGKDNLKQCASSNGTNEALLKCDSESVDPSKKSFEGATKSPSSNHLETKCRTEGPGCGMDIVLPSEVQHGKASPCASDNSKLDFGLNMIASECDSESVIAKPS